MATSRAVAGSSEPIDLGKRIILSALVPHLILEVDGNVLCDLAGSHPVAAIQYSTLMVDVRSDS